MVHYTDKFIKKFKEFLVENVKTKEYSFEAYLEELDKQHGASGSNEYELSNFESKSGNPELFSYDVEYIATDDDCYDVIYDI